MATKRNAFGVTKTRSGILIVPAYAARNAINDAIREKNAAQRRVNALKQAAKKLAGAGGKK